MNIIRMNDANGDCNNVTLYFVKALDIQNIRKGYYAAQADKRVTITYGEKSFLLNKGDWIILNPNVSPPDLEVWSNRKMRVQEQFVLAGHVPPRLHSLLAAMPNYEDWRCSIER